VLVRGNTIYSSGSHGIYLDIAATMGSITGNLIHTAGGYGIYNNNAATQQHAMMANNAFYCPTSGQVSGFGEEGPNLWPITETDDPLTDPANDDFTLKSTASGKGAVFPGSFENESLIGYLDAGAVQRQEAASGGTVYVPQSGGGLGVWRS
jgi:hypothetical protein